MKTQRIKIYSLKLVTLPLLALLLLLSPCSVKGAMQMALEVEVTRSLHKNKTSAPQLNMCSVWDNQSLSATKEATKKDDIKVITKPFSSRLFNTSTNRKAVIWAEHLVSLHAELPLYILYKRLKIYDLNTLHFV